MKRNAERQAAPPRPRQEPYRVERRFTPGRRASDMVRTLMRAHGT